MKGGRGGVFVTARRIADPAVIFDARCPPTLSERIGILAAVQKGTRLRSGCGDDWVGCGQPRILLGNRPIRRIIGRLNGAV